MPPGADVNTAVYLVDEDHGAAYFLKLRKGDFAEISATLPRYLKNQGLGAIIAPLETHSGQL